MIWLAEALCHLLQVATSSQSWKLVHDGEVLTYDGGGRAALELHDKASLNEIWNNEITVWGLQRGQKWMQNLTMGRFNNNWGRKTMEHGGMHLL